MLSTPKGFSIPFLSLLRTCIRRLLICGDSHLFVSCCDDFCLCHNVVIQVPGKSCGLSSVCECILLRHLTEEGMIRPISHRSFFFLVTHGGAAPFSLVPLAERLDPAPADDPAAIAEQADLVSTVLIEGIRRYPSS